MAYSDTPLERNLMKKIFDTVMYAAGYVVGFIEGYFTTVFKK